MGIGEVATNTAIDLVKNENVQNKAASLLGMLFPYAGLEKRALDVYLSDIEKSNLSCETKLIATLGAKATIKKLKNQKSVADYAISNIKESTVLGTHSGVNQDWLDRFMDSAGYVSEEQTQQIWGKVLAKEFDAPGSTPHNMVRILSEITSTHAEAFQKICSMQRVTIFLATDGSANGSRRDIVVPYDGHETEMLALGLSFSLFHELETLGLIKFNSLSGFAATEIPEKDVITYVDGMTQEILSHSDDRLSTGNVMLTEAGRCLCNIIQTTTIPNYVSMEKDYMISHGVVFKEESDYIIREDITDHFGLIQDRITEFSSVQDHISELKAQEASLEHHIQELQSKPVSSAADSSRVNELTKAITELQKEKDGLIAVIGVQKEISTLTEERDSLKRERDRAKEAYKQQVLDNNELEKQFSATLSTIA